MMGLIYKEEVKRLVFYLCLIIDVILLINFSLFALGINQRPFLGLGLYEAFMLCLSIHVFFDVVLLGALSTDQNKSAWTKVTGGIPGSWIVVGGSIILIPIAVVLFKMPELGVYGDYAYATLMLFVLLTVACWIKTTLWVFIFIFYVPKAYIIGMPTSCVLQIPVFLVGPKYVANGGQLVRDIDEARKFTGFRGRLDAVICAENLGFRAVVL